MYASQARLPIYLEIYVILLRRLEEYTTHPYTRYILTIHNITSHSESTHSTETAYISSFCGKCASI